MNRESNGKTGEYVYLYGQVMATNSFRLEGEFPLPDSYSGIEERYFHPGGETGTAALILASLGLHIKVAGTHTGERNQAIIEEYFDKRGIDYSEIAHSDFEGAVDYVFISGDSRTIFGEFGKYYQRKEAWYEPASEESIQNSLIAAIDPYWGSEGIEYCKKHGIKFVTIDSPYDSNYCRYCEIIAISHEYLDSTYPGIKYEELMELYTSQTDGLVIFTMGNQPLYYSRKGSGIKNMDIFHVEVKSTLGAGDSFKAGCVYALYQAVHENQIVDETIVRTASAIAACACTCYPIAVNPPTKERILKVAGVSL